MTSQHSSASSRIPQSSPKWSPALDPVARWVGFRFGASSERVGRASVWAQFVVLVVAAAAGGCAQQAHAASEEGPSTVEGRSAGLSTEVERLRGAHAREQQRLTEIRKEIAEAESRAAEAKTEAKIAECRATASRVEATLESTRAQCQGEVARQARCLAKEAKKRGNSNLLGCLGGIFVSTLTAGSAAPVALAGCATGAVAGELAAKECPAPACVEEWDDLESRALAEMGLESLPACGGYAGVELADGVILVQGWRVVEVGPYTFAANAHLRAGDTIVAIAGHSLSEDNSSAANALGAVRPGDALAVDFYRDGTRYRITRPAMTVDVNGRRADQVLLGIRHRAWLQPIATRTRISHLDQAGPAARAGVIEGDILVSVDGAHVGSPMELAKALGQLDGGKETHFTVSRLGRTLELPITLERRRDQAGI